MGIYPEDGGTGGGGGGVGPPGESSITIASRADIPDMLRELGVPVVYASQTTYGLVDYPDESSEMHPSASDLVRRKRFITVQSGVFASTALSKAGTITANGETLQIQGWISETDGGLTRIEAMKAVV